MLQNLMLFWIPYVTRLFHVQHRFSAFWLRSKCSICSYQLNIWYGGHVPPSILNWFLQGDEVQELAPASSRVGLALQCCQDRPTSPLRPRDPHHHQQNQTIFYHNKCKIWPVICCSNKAFINTTLGNRLALCPIGNGKSGLTGTNIDVNPKDLLTTMTVEMKNVFNLNLLFICCVKTTLV